MIDAANSAAIILLVATRGTEVATAIGLIAHFSAEAWAANTLFFQKTLTYYSSIQSC